MKTFKNRQNFLVLVPHRDIRGILRKNGEKQFKENCSGFYTFPWVAPLASLSEPLSADELKNITHSLREITNGEKFNAVDYSYTVFPSSPDNMKLFGPKLDLILSPRAFGTAVEKIESIFSPVVIGVCLIPETFEQQVRVGLCGSWLTSSSEIPLAKISFRAAAVANMHWQPFQLNNEKCFKWEIEKLFWLPKKIKTA
ncbi:MAG: hypothetical protein LBG94_00185 [Treponema sp.]|jgi:hypothetical protein|nr:hypothetical protein [Treponema sp.]